MQTIQVYLSLKQNTFSEFFSAFSKSASNFEVIQKKYDPHSFCISEITHLERRGSINV